MVWKAFSFSVYSLTLFPKIISFSDFLCSRSDDIVEDDKEKKEPDFLTIENGIAPNHGFAFLLFFIILSLLLYVCVYTYIIHTCYK